MPSCSETTGSSRKSRRCQLAEAVATRCSRSRKASKRKPDEEEERDERGRMNRGDEQRTRYERRHRPCELAQSPRADVDGRMDALQAQGELLAHSEKVRERVPRVIARWVIGTRGPMRPRRPLRLLGPSVRADTAQNAARGTRVGTNGPRPSVESRRPNRAPPCRRTGSSLAEHPVLVGQAHQSAGPDPASGNHGQCHDDRELTRWGGVGLAPVADGHARQAIPNGTISTKRRANRTPACRARASRRYRTSSRRSSARSARRRSTSEPPSSCAMSSVSQTASAVASASCSFEHADGAREVCRDQPFAMGRFECRSQLSRRRATCLEQRLRQRATERAREHADLLDQTRPRLVRGLASGATSPPGDRSRERWRRSPDDDRREQRTEERLGRGGADDEGAGDQHGEVTWSHTRRGRLGSSKHARRSRIGRRGPSRVRVVDAGRASRTGTP